MTTATTTQNDINRGDPKFTAKHKGFTVEFYWMNHYGSWLVRDISPGPDHLDVRKMVFDLEYPCMSHPNEGISIIATREEIEAALQP